MTVERYFPHPTHSLTSANSNLLSVHTTFASRGFSVAAQAVCNLLLSSAVRIFKILNRIVTSVFDLIRTQHNYSKFSNTYVHRFLTYLREWRRFFTFASTLSSQQNQLLTMVQVLYLLEVFILAHYGSPSTETPTTETTIVRCHKNSWIYLTSTYYWWLLRPTITIRFDSKFQIIVQVLDSIPFEMKKNTIRTALLVTWVSIQVITDNTQGV